MTSFSQHPHQTRTTTQDFSSDEQPLYQPSILRPIARRNPQSRRRLQQQHATHYNLPKSAEPSGAKERAHFEAAAMEIEHILSSALPPRSASPPRLVPNRGCQSMRPPSPCPPSVEQRDSPNSEAFFEKSFDDAHLAAPSHSMYIDSQPLEQEEEDFEPPKRCLTPPLRAVNPISMDRNFELFEQEFVDDEMPSSDNGKQFYYISSCDSSSSNQSTSTHRNSGKSCSSTNSTKQSSSCPSRLDCHAPIDIPSHQRIHKHHSSEMGFDMSPPILA